MTKISEIWQLRILCIAATLAFVDQPHGRHAPLHRGLAIGSGLIVPWMQAEAAVKKRRAAKSVL